MSILDGLKQILDVAKDIQTVPVIQERLALAKEQLLIVEKQFATLESENAYLRSQLECLKKEDEYLDLAICALKKNPAGGYFPSPLCSKCKLPLSKFGSQSLSCADCSTKVELTKVNAVVRKALAK